MAFNINAAVVLSGPKNIQKVSSNIRKQLSGINVPVKIQLDKNTARGIKSVNTQLKGLNTTLSTLQKNAASTAASFNSLANSTRTIQGAATKVNSATNSVNKSLANTAKSATLAGNALQDFGKDAALAVRRFAAFSAATGIVFGFTRAVTTATKEAIQFQRELAKITQVTGQAGKNLDGLRRTIDSLSTGLGLGANELLGVARTFAQTGQSIDQVRKSLAAVSKASLAPTFGDIKQTTEGAIAALSQFKLEADKLEGVLGSLNQVSKRFAVESDDLISVIRRAGGVFAASSQQLGAPEERLRELIGIFTAVRSTTRESADTIATGLRTIFTRIQRPQTIEFLKQFGVQLRATKADAQALGIAEGDFIGIFEALKRISKASKGLDTLQTARLVEELGGVRQVGKLIPALQNFEKAEKAVQVALKGRGSIAKDVGIATQTLSVQIEQLQQRFGKLIRDIADSSTFQNLAKFAIQTANAFITLADALRPILPALTAIAAVKIGAATFDIARGFVGGIRKGGGAAGVGAGVANLATGGGASQAQQTATQKQAAAAASKNTAALNSNTSALKTLNTSISNLQRSSQTLNTSAGKLTTQASTLNATLARLPSQIAASTRGGGAIPIVGGRGRRRAAGGKIPKFKNGGFVEGASHAQGGVVAELEGGELVVPKKQAQRLAGTGTGRVISRATDPDLFGNQGFSAAFGKFLNRSPVGGGRNTKVSQKQFADLDAATQDKLVKDFRKTQQSTTKAAGATKKDKSKVKKVNVLLNQPPSFAGLFLTGTERPEVGSKAISKGLPTKAKTKLLTKAKKAGFTGAKEVGIQGSIAQFVSDKNKRLKGIDEETAKAAQDAFQDATETALTSPKLQIGEKTPFKVSKSKIKTAVAPLFAQDKGKVNSAQATIQGYLLEGIIGVMGNITPQSSEANFDFLFKQGKNVSFGGLSDFFGQQASAFNILTAGDAKRQAGGKSVTSIFQKTATYLSQNPFAGDANFVAARNGRLIGGRGMSPVRVSNGEGLISPDVAKGNLQDLERARKGNSEAISRVSNLPISKIQGPGSGTSDSISGSVAAGSFVLPARSMKKMREQRLNVGGVVKGIGSAVKKDPTTALFLGLEASLLATSKSSEEFKSNLVNAGLTLAFFGPQLKEFAANIKNASKELSKSAGAQASASTKPKAPKLTANEKFFADIRRGNAILKGGSGINPGLNAASKAQLGDTSQALGRVAKDKTAKANALTSKSNALTLKSNKATEIATKEVDKAKTLAAKRNTALKNVASAEQRLGVLTSQRTGLEQKLQTLQGKRAALVAKQNQITADLASKQARLAQIQGVGSKAGLKTLAQQELAAAKGSQGKFSQGQIKTLEGNVRRIELEEKLLKRQTTGGGAQRGAANVGKQISALDDQIKPLNKGVQNLSGKITKQTAVVASNTKTAKTTQAAFKTQAEVAKKAVANQRTARAAAAPARAAAINARGVAQAATGRLRDFNTLARAEQGRRALSAGTRTARIAGKADLTRAQRFERVRSIREARFARLNPGAKNPFAKGRFGFKGFQAVGKAGRVGGSGLAAVGSKAGTIAKAGLGGPGGIAALLASLFGDAVVNAGTEAIVGKQKTVAGAKGFSAEQGGRRTAAITGGLKGGISGAALGASIGLSTGPLAPILAPVFAAVGALVGTVDGVLGGLKGQLEFETLEKAENAGLKLGNALDTLSEKGFKNVEALDAVTDASNGLVSQVVATSSRLNALTISGRQEGLASVGGTDSFGGSVQAFASFSDQLSLGFNLLGKVLSQETGTGIEGFSNTISGLIDNALLADQTLSESSNSFVSFFGSIRKGTAELLGFDVEGRANAARQKIVGGSQLINAENFQRSLIAIPQEALEKASITFQGLGPAIANSISIDDVAEIAGQGAGSFDDLLESLEAAGDGSKEFKAQLAAFKGLAGVEALKQAKDLSGVFSEIAAAGKDSGREGLLKTLFAIGENSAQAFAQGVSSGKSFEESGQLAGEKFTEQIQARLNASRSGINLKEIGIDDLEDLQNKLQENPALLTRLSGALGVNSQELSTLINQTDGYISSVENQITAQIAAEQKQRLVNDLLRTQAQGLDAFAAALEDLDARVGNIVSDFTTTASNVQQEVSRIFSTQQKVSAVGRVNVFAGGGRGRSREELQAGVDRVQRAIQGDASDFADLPDTIALGNKLPQALKDTVDQIDREGGKFTFEEVKDKLIDNINAEGDIFSGLSKPVREQFEASLEGVFVGLRQGGGELGIDGIKKQLEVFGGIQEKFSQLSDQTASVLENVTNNLNTFNAAILESANLVVEASRQRVDAELDVLNRQASFEDQFGKFQTGQRDPLTKARTRLADRTRTLVNAGGAGTANVGGVNLGGVGGGDLLARRQGLENIRGNLLKKIGELTGVDTTNADDAIQAAQGIDGADQLISELGNTTAALEGTKRAIEEQTNETARLSAIESKLSSIQESRLSERQRLQAGLGQLQNAKTPEERNRVLNEIQRPFIAANKLAAGQALTVQEGAALQSDLLSGNTGIVANAFRQQNPGATEEEIADFIENSLANFQVGGQNLFKGLGLSQGAVDAVFGKADGPGATAKGKTKEEQSLLSEAEKIQQEQLKLIEGTVNQNTDLLTAQQDIYKQKIIETTEALKTAADAFAALRDKEQELLALSQQRLEQTKQVALEEAKVEEEKKLDEAEKRLGRTEAERQSRLSSFAKGEEVVGKNLGVEGLFKGLFEATGTSAAGAERNAQRAFRGNLKGENRTADIVAQLTGRVSALAFKGENTDESRAFTANLQSKLEEAAAGGNIESPRVAARFNKIISDALSSEKSGFIQRTDKVIAEDAATVKKSKEGIAAKDKEIEASKKAQADLKKKAQEEAASREAAKKARDAANKQAAGAAPGTPIGPEEARVKQEIAEENKKLDEAKKKASQIGSDSPVDLPPVISEEDRKKLAAKAEADRKAEQQARIDAARKKDQAAASGPTGNPLLDTKFSATGLENVDPVTLAGGEADFAQQQAKNAALQAGLRAQQQPAAKVAVGNLKSTGRISQQEADLQVTRELLGPDFTGKIAGAETGGLAGDSRRAVVAARQQEAKRAAEAGEKPRTQAELVKAGLLEQEDVDIANKSFKLRSSQNRQARAREKQIAAEASDPRKRARRLANLEKEQKAQANRKALFEEKGGAKRLTELQETVGPLSEEQTKELSSLKRLSTRVGTGEKRIQALSLGGQTGLRPSDAPPVGAPSDPIPEVVKNAKAQQQVQRQTEQGVPTQAQGKIPNPAGQPADAKSGSGGAQAGGAQTLSDAVNTITSSTFAKDLLSAANKLSELETLNINFEGSIKPIEVILNGGGLLQQLTEGVKQELVPLISSAVQEQLRSIN